MTVRSADEGAQRAGRIIFPCDPALPSDHSKIAQTIATFRAKYPHGRVVSVFPSGEGEDATELGTAAMRDLLPYGEFMETWRRAYRLVDGVLAQADQNLNAVLRPFYHPIASFSLQALLIIAALQRWSGPLLVLAPPAGAKFYRDLPAELMVRPWSLRRLKLGNFRLARVARAGRDVLHEMMNRTSKGIPGSSPAPGVSSGPVVLVMVEEGVSGLNLPSARAIVAELRGSDATVVLLTSIPHIRSEFELAGVQVLYCGIPKLTGLRPRIFVAWRKASNDLNRLRATITQWETRALIDQIAERLLAYAVFHARVESLLSDCHRLRPIGVGLAINEGTPSTVAALGWLAAQGIPDVGYWPALLGNWPDSEFFPAHRHLVYGDDLRDKMLGLGLPVESVESVGSVNFDRAIGRDHQRDVDYVQREILRGRATNEKLVVVATEALPNPLEELEPVLDVLVRMPNVEIVFKLHPADSVEFYGRLLARRGWNDRIVLVEKCDLDALLHTADLLICVFSNIIVNAAHLGTPTLVCDFSGKRHNLDFVAARLATGCFERENLAATLPAMIYDGPVRREAMSRLKSGAVRFNQGADGRSAVRVATRVLSLLPTERTASGRSP